MLSATEFQDYAELSRFAANWLAARLRSVPDLLWCLAAGSTPVSTYRYLKSTIQLDPGLADTLRVIQLDEWGGLPRNDMATCERNLKENLLRPLNLRNRFVSFDSDPPDPPAECARVADWLASNGPIDTCVLGLGLNGHLGFNEPGPTLQPHAHVAMLFDSSLDHAMVRNAARQPTYGLTLGMADILTARRILLLVSGESKRAALARLLTGPITTEFPASFLHCHPDVKLLCDAASTSA